ncbi:hypothetical protein IscW_ISCW021114 [Ixodes scapularis]|uniref:Ig-like domain-containing protein n=1 Tax=Ixodes scapularis TaxID=6945 RepID=B7Q9N2_IXOSC|nr:hypothetical protein IscW_ISCW021114 [Ixodes scapularis]|eukprot:XP_002406160.1 hypothetical protein IscW_ISCW021114 [Ixodes scapularis]
MYTPTIFEHEPRPRSGSLPVQTEAIFWEAPPSERNFSERLDTGQGSSSSSSLLPGPGPAAPIHRGGRATEGAVSWSFSTGVGGEPPSRPSAHWDDPHFRPRFDNSTNRNVTAQLGKSAFLRCRITQLGERTVSPRQT